MRQSIVVTILLLGLTACAAAPHRIASDPPAPLYTAGADLPANFVLSTNEPFWQGSVEGGRVLLRGLDGERSLSVDENQLLPDGRLVNAHDASGRVMLRITPRPCQDSMSGADFPYTGKLAFDDGQAIAGCARPAGTAPADAP
ncbi:hypothetical protein [Pseudoxanthomonas dokdonensis]|uniref:hypothetical protein n=1 Tax=Pseudoxanthomonas dokdonensis TaxID=344882 RepID=UPI0012ED946D|nr:hypothetical protein [Pseudoxanthomonas dokdonensis]